MPVHPAIPDALDRYLRTSSDEESTGIAGYIQRGAPMITPEAILSLRSMLPALRAKTALIKDSDRLTQRLEILLAYFEGSPAAHALSDAAFRDVAFALIYFLKGYDRIPDSVPEIGFLDDALIVNTVLQWHYTPLQTHWLRQGRPWPTGI